MAKEVVVSDYVRETSALAIKVCRLVGIFPIAIQRNRSNTWILKWSVGYMVYGFVLGLTLLTATYAGWARDVTAGKEKTIKIKSTTDIYISFCDITVVELVVIFGVYVIPLRFKTFSSYMECINEVDSILLPVDSKRARKTSMVTILIIIAMTTLVWVADLLVRFHIDGKRVGELQILESYIGFYLSHYVMLMMQYQLWHLGYDILRRLRRLNQHLSEVEDGKHVEKLYPRSFEEKEIGSAIDSLKAAIRKDDTRLVLTDDQRVRKLMRAYLRLCDAVELQDKLMGFVGAILITGVLLQLILSTYGLFVELAGTRRDGSVAFMMTVWCVAHLARLLMIVEPSHACITEAQVTKDLVCKLLCSNTSDEMKVQLEGFAMALFHRRIEFFASGLAAVDRSLVTSVIGAITTYLVILLQFVKPE